jgi:hypothetical protein
MCRISLTSTPRPTSSSRAATMSVTTRCVPRYVPGAASVRPTPIVSEQADPGGVICTTRKSSLGRWSTSSVNPAVPT